MTLIPHSRFVLAQQVNKHPVIIEIVAVEPEIQQLLELAACPTPRYNRWISYEALKRQASKFVGWDARNPALQTEKHYEVMIWAFDLLLPSSDEDVLDESIYEEQWQALLAQWRQHERGRRDTWYQLNSEGA